MSLIAFLLQKGTIPLWDISAHKILNLTFTMQMLVLPVSFIALLLIRLYNKENFNRFFRLGFSKNNKWNSYGPLIAVSFTVGTAMLMSIGVNAQGGSMNERFFDLIPFVILFSVTNAWSEEIFSRLVIVAGLHRKINPSSICWISAIIFGLPHFLGTPSGLFGVIMSGLLGWLLARSVLETKGIGWALFIHFLQDVMIFGAGAMIIAGE